MITPDEAREMAKSIQTAKVENSLKHVDESIRRAAKENKRQCSTTAFYGDAGKVAMKEIKDLGYTIKHHPECDPRDPRESEYWIISW